MRAITNEEYIKRIVDTDDIACISTEVMRLRMSGFKYNEIAFVFKEAAGIDLEEFEELMQVCDEQDAW